MLVSTDPPWYNLYLSPTFSQVFNVPYLLCINSVLHDTPKEELRCVKALHGHFRDDFNVSIIHYSDEFECFWVKNGNFIRNMTSSGLFTKKPRLLNRNFLLNTLSNMGYKTHLLAISGETIDSRYHFFM